MMASTATRNTQAQNRKLWIGLWVVSLCLIGAIVTFLVVKLPHNEHDHDHIHNSTLPTPPNVTLTYLTTTPYPTTSPWTFAVQVSDLTHLQVELGVTPMYTYENASGVIHPNVGDTLAFRPDPTQLIYSGNLTVSSHLDPAVGSKMLQDQAHGLFSPVLSVSSLMNDGRPVLWMCVPQMTPAAAVSALSSSRPVQCRVITMAVVEP